MRRWTAGRGDEAVSSVVGTVLMLAITMSVFAGLAYVVLDRTSGQDDRLRSDLEVESRDGRLLLQHRGGDPLLLSRGTLQATVDDAVTTVPLTDFAAQVADGQRWRIGESLCLAGPQPPCRFAEGSVSDLALVYGGLLAIDGLPASAGRLLTYVGGLTLGTGTVDAFTSAQAAADAGAEATLTEAATLVPGASATGTSSPTAQASNSATNPTFVYAGALSGDASDQRALLDASGDWVEASGFSLPAQAATVSSVTIGFEGRKESSGGTDPIVQLSYKVGGVAGATTTSRTLTSTTDGATTVAVTADRAWTVADIANLAVRVQVTNSASRVAGIDHVYVTVQYATAAATTYSLSAQLDFSAVPDAGTQELQLRYRATGDTFRVQVWNGAAFVTRGAVLDAASATAWSYVLTEAEANDGAPRLRLVDATPSGTTAGALHLDYVRVEGL